MVVLLYYLYLDYEEAELVGLHHCNSMEMANIDLCSYDLYRTLVDVNAGCPIASYLPQNPRPDYSADN